MSFIYNFIHSLLLFTAITSFFTGNCEKFSTFCKKFHGDKVVCHPTPTDEPFYRTSVFENPYSLILVLFLFFLLFLLLLGKDSFMYLITIPLNNSPSGVIKGIIGRFNRQIGEFGLHLLIDLPKPLDHYNEPELKDRTVVYDVGGWPLHPDDGTRTVRLLPFNAEFCLNAIFFLAYPLSLCMQLCGLCCCIKESDEMEDNTPYKGVNVVKFSKSKSKVKNRCLPVYFHYLTSLFPDECVHDRHL